MTASADPDDLLARALAGEDPAFAALVTAHERSVFRHCYRMLGSGRDAEDAVQDTLERAWRKLATYDGSGSFGAWLHRIATNVCLDALRTRRVRLAPAGSGPAAAPDSILSPPDLEAAWVEPVSDAELSGAGDPQETLLRREKISLAFVAALQRLAPRQRAALLLHDVLGFSHAETAEVLAVSTRRREPGEAGARLVVTGLQIVQLSDVNGALLITALVSYRDPVVAVRCGLPAVIDLS